MGIKPTKLRDDISAIQADLIFQLGQFAEKLKLLGLMLFCRKKAVALAPNSSRLTGLLGSALLQSGDVEDARASFLASKDGRIAQGADLLAAAHGFLKLGDLALSKQTFLRAADNAGEGPRVMLGSGCVKLLA